MTTMSLYQQVIHATRYARWREEDGRREYWNETAGRYVDFFEGHLKERCGYKLPAKVKAEVYDSIYQLDVMPSMRTLMTSGQALQSAEIANYNCTYCAVDNPRVFSEHMYVLMCGSGSGFSVERRFVDKLPEVPEELHPSDTTIVFVDSRKGWCAGFNQFLNLLYAGNVPKWDVSKLRPEGARLKTFGGYASGPKPLVELLEHVIKVFKNAQGRKLKPVEVFSIMCYIAQIVVVGGVRRSATIALFDKDDQEMLRAKSGTWWVHNAHYAMANVSAVFESKPDDLEFMDFWRALVASGSGEPGMLNRKALWDQAEAIGRKSRYENGERIPFGVNPCSLPADQFIMTPQGPRRISRLLEEPSESLIVDGIAYDATAFIQTAVKEVFDVTTVEGFTFAGTDNHEFQLADMSWKYLRDLLPGDKVRVHAHRNALAPLVEAEADKGWLLGEVVGDGGHNPSKYYTYTRFWGEDCERLADEAIRLTAKYFSVDSPVQRGLASACCNPSHTVSSTALTSFAKDYITDGYKDILPNLEEASESFVRGFIAGYFDADGSIIGDLNKGVSARLASVNFKRLQSVQRMLARLGVYSVIYPRRASGHSLLPDGKSGSAFYDTQQLFELVVSRCSLDRFYEYIPLKGAKADTLSSLLSLRRRAPYASKFYARVEKVTLRGVEPVYDARVDKVECFDANGIVAHNSEIQLPPNSCCNLSGVAIRPGDTLEDIKRKIRLATIIGTWQATVTDFDYLRAIWKKNVDEERLLGVCLAGIMDHPVLSKDDAESEKWFQELQAYVWEVNKEWATKLGINTSASVTAIKPAGNSGELYDVASGIHPRYAPYYIRTIRQSNGDPMTQFLKDIGLPHEVSTQNARDTVFSFPIKSPDTAICAKDMTAIQQLNHWLHVKKHYTTHTISATVYVRSGEWLEVGSWVYKNFDDITGLSFLPYDDHTYQQAPYQPCSKEQFEAASEVMPKEIDWSLLRHYEQTDTTTVSQEFACTSGGCALT